MTHHLKAFRIRREHFGRWSKEAKRLTENLGVPNLIRPYLTMKFLSKLQFYFEDNFRPFSHSKSCAKKQNLIAFRLCSKHHDQWFLMQKHEDETFHYE